MSRPKTKNLLKLACGLPLVLIFAGLGHWDAAGALLAGLGYLAWEIWREPETEQTIGTDERNLT